MSAFPGHLSVMSSLVSHPALRKGVWGLSDQALLSASNFITMVLIARAVSPADFGLYSLAYTGLLFSNSIQAALIIQPHTVLGARRSGSSYARYTTGTAWMQTGLAMVAALAVLMMALVASAAGWPVTSILLAMIPAAAAWPMQNFVRRAMYTRSNISGAFLNDTVSYGGQAAILIALWRSSHLTSVTAILTLAATSAAGFLIGLWQIRRHLDPAFTWSEFREVTGENWTFGKWLVAGNIAFWTSGQVYPVLAAGLVSVAATGVMRAAQTIIGPTNVLISSLDPLFGPRASRTYARGGLPALRTLLSRMQIIVLALMGAYCIAATVFAEQIFRYVYGPEYSQYSWMLAFVALTTLVSALRSPIRIGLKAMGQTNAVFRIYLVSSIGNLTLGIVVVYLFGFKGVALGLVLNSIVQQAALWHYQRKFLGKTQTRDPDQVSTIDDV